MYRRMAPKCLVRSWVELTVVLVLGAMTTSVVTWGVPAGPLEILFVTLVGTMVLSAAAWTTWGALVRECRRELRRRLPDLRIHGTDLDNVKLAHHYDRAGDEVQEIFEVLAVDAPIHPPARVLLEALGMAELLAAQGANTRSTPAR